MAHLIPTLSAPNVNYVQIDSLVIMKIVKHVDSELYAGMSAVSSFPAFDCVFFWFSRILGETVI